MLVTTMSDIYSCHFYQGYFIGIWKRPSVIFSHPPWRIKGIFKFLTSRMSDLISSTDHINMFYQMGYIGDISLLPKFKKTNLPLIWNGLFTLFFKSISERVVGSDSACKLFYTLIYVLYAWVKLDCGTILWTQLIQSTVSTTRHSEISCARFWSVIVKGALTHFQVSLNDDSVMDSILFLQTSSFMVSDASKFSFFGSI